MERKSIEPMADALAGGNVQAMRQFIGLGAWDDDAVLAKHQQLAAETPGDPATGVLIVDGCDSPKEGTRSVGVARQWCGPLGKVANRQASAVACYVSARGATPWSCKRTRQLRSLPTATSGSAVPNTASRPLTRTWIRSRIMFDRSEPMPTFARGARVARPRARDPVQRARGWAT